MKKKKKADQISTEEELTKHVFYNFQPRRADNQPQNIHPRHSPLDKINSGEEKRK